MYTKAAIAEDTFGGTSIRPHVHYSHTDPLEGDQWLVACPACGGNGYDIETEGFSVCSSCAGLGEYGPFSEHEVRSFFREGA